MTPEISKITRFNTLSPSLRSALAARLAGQDWGAYSIVLGQYYLVGLLLWLALQATVGDGWWWLFFLNAGAIYLFLPLPALALFVAISRRREAWGYVGGVVLLWGVAFLPTYIPYPTFSTIGPTLSAVSYNVLGFNDQPDAVIAALRQMDADVVGIQELNPHIAEALQQQLSDTYPYQVLDPQAGVTGMGVISRYPLFDTGQTLPGGWIGRPQVLRLDFDGSPVTILNFHAYPYTVAPPEFDSTAERLNWAARAREAQVQTARDFVAATPGPLIAMTDLNATDQNRAYRNLARSLQDGWAGAGWGPGHTFPGDTTLNGRSLPDWLARIDYVFHSDHWQATSARVGPLNGGSDHRPVLVTLQMLVD